MGKRESQARGKADVYISVYKSAERKQCDLDCEKAATLPKQRKVKDEKMRVKDEFLIE